MKGSVGVGDGGEYAATRQRSMLVQVIIEKGKGRGAVESELILRCLLGPFPGRVSCNWCACMQSPSLASRGSVERNRL